jgi:glycosyltransferase involved in cell wall biosynthesis
MDSNNITPQVTVLTATYQGDKYITDALNSIRENLNDLQQHGVKLKIQVIIVDDGSTDNTEITVKEFFAKNQELKLSFLKQKNQGQAQAFQNALPYIKGEITFLLDSDDRFLSHKIREVYKKFSENQTCVMVTHPQFIINELGDRTRAISPKAAKLSTGDIAQKAKLTGSIVAPASSGLCFRTKTFQKIHPSPACGLKPCSGADSYLSLAASLQGPIIAIEEPLSEYRRHQQGKFLKRLSTIQGLKTQIELQKKMETRLNLTDCVKHNAYFARIEYIHSKMTENTQKTFPKLANLIKTTIKDNNFKLKDKTLLIGFWGLSFLAPKKLFWKLWLHFLRIR